MHRLPATEIKARLALASKPEAHLYGRLFSKAATEAGETPEKDAWLLLWSLCYFPMQMRDAGAKGPPIITADNRKDARLLTDEEIQFVREVLADAEDPELRARLGDILWLARKDHKAARAAVEDYLASAERLMDPEEWVACAERFDRALGLAKTIGARDLVSRIEAAVLDALRRLDGQDPKYLSVHLHETLLDNKLGDPKTCAPLAEKAAREAAKSANWRRSGLAWRTVAAWRKRMGDAPGARAANLEAAWTYVGDADEALKRQPPSHGAAAHFVEQAIHALRQESADRADIDKLHARLLEHQKLMRREGIEYSQPIDTKEAEKAVQAWVTRDNLPDALLQFSRIHAWPSKKELSTFAIELREASTFRQILGHRTVGKTGKTVARPTPPIDASKDPARNELLGVQHFHQTYTAATTVLPAARAIMEQHEVNIGDLLPFLQGNPLVPEGRENAWARGLLAGFRGEFTDAATLLIPQFEEAVRGLLAARGVVTSTLASDGVQDEMDLNALLFRDELKQVFDDDLIFELQGLLVDRHGSNLRNLLAHGIADEREAFAPSAYAWWLLILLIMWPFRPEVRIPPESAPAPPPGA